MYRKLARRLLFAAFMVLLPLVTTVTPAGAVLQCADLVVTDLSMTPTTSPYVNQNVQVSVTVKNQGTCDVTTGFVVQWKSGQLGAKVLSTTINQLLAGDSTTVTFDYAYPNAGNFLSIATADSGNAVAETVESNNSKLLPVSVAPATIDLQITNFVINPNPAVATDPAHATITVKNNGNTDAGPFKVQWQPGANAPSQTIELNGLAAGASTDVGFDYTFLAAATVTTTATVDSTNLVRETNENNNTQSQTLTVDPPLSDLIVKDVSINPPNPIAGQPVQLTVTVQNVGHRATDTVNPGDFVVQWRPMPLAQPLTQQVNGPLGVGDTATVTFDYTYQAGGSFTGTITADSTGRVREVHEDNNTQQFQVAVAAKTIDLAISNFTVNPATPTQGENTTFSVTVVNNGNTEADNFTVSVNPDALGLSTPGLQTLTIFVGSLGPGASQTFDLPTFQYPKPGNYRAVAMVDAFNNVSESNEANNTALINFSVNPGNIDLRVTGFTLATDLCAQAKPNGCSPMQFWKGSSITATITVQNFGSYPAGTFAVQWLLHDTDAFGPSVTVPGLAAAGHPGDTATVTIHGTYSGDSSKAPGGQFTTVAKVDPFNQVTEPCAGCENNNTMSQSITVLPRTMSVSVAMTDFYVFNDLDDGLAGSGEWNMWFAALDPNATCNISFSKFSKDFKGLQCPFFYKSPDGAGDNGSGPTINLTLTEGEPLALAIFGVEDDLPTGVDNPGYSFKVFLPGDFYDGQTFQMAGQKGDGRCGNGECFYATIQITVNSAPPPPANVGAVVPAASASDVTNQTLNVVSSLANATTSNAPGGPQP